MVVMTVSVWWWRLWWPSSWWRRRWWWWKGVKGDEGMQCTVGTWCGLQWRIFHRIPILPKEDGFARKSSSCNSPKGPTGNTSSKHGVQKQNICSFSNIEEDIQHNWKHLLETTRFTQREYLSSLQKCQLECFLIFWMGKVEESLRGDIFRRKSAIAAAMKETAQKLKLMSTLVTEM